MTPNRGCSHRRLSNLSLADIVSNGVTSKLYHSHVTCLCAGSIVGRRMFVTGEKAVRDV